MSEFLDEMIHKLGLFLVLALIWFLSAEGRPLPQFLDYRAAYKTSSGGALHTTNLWSLYSEKKMKMTYDDGKGDMIGALLYLDRYENTKHHLTPKKRKYTVPKVQPPHTIFIKRFVARSKWNTSKEKS
eukprot:TRINITY_DN5792_c0_g1_i2.p1 TRINITY_DN5792_c0_g1~~TRINITY_DN5792_c0_g1_i2.p1  ORF type:complete len:128 (+),score=2.68 TRINITY_DN5792_c0_g1_i2:72-455(+)